MKDPWTYCFQGYISQKSSTMQAKTTNQAEFALCKISLQQIVQLNSLPGKVPQPHCASVFTYAGGVGDCSNDLLELLGEGIVSQQTEGTWNSPGDINSL